MTDTERQHLHLAGAHYRHPGAKETAIRKLGTSPAQHAQIILGLLERADAEAEEPVLVHRLRRVMEARRGGRVSA